MKFNYVSTGGSMASHLLYDERFVVCNGNRIVITEFQGYCKKNQVAQIWSNL